MGCWLGFSFFSCILFTNPAPRTSYTMWGRSCVHAFFSILCVYAHHVRDVCIVAAVRALTDWWWFYYLLILKEARCARIKIYCWVFFPKSWRFLVYRRVTACWQPHGRHLFQVSCTTFYIDKDKNICVLGFRHMVRISKDPLIIHSPTLQYATYVLWFRALETPETIFWNGDPVCNAQLQSFYRFIGCQWNLPGTVPCLLRSFV